MREPDPVDDVSAGFFAPEDPQRPQAPGAPATPEPVPGPAPALTEPALTEPALARVLEPLLGPRFSAARAAQAVFPAVLALRSLRESVDDEHPGRGWDGLVHRRCRIEALPPTPAVRPRRPQRPRPDAGAVDWRRAGDWWLGRASRAVGRMLVTHWLARREGGPVADGVPPDGGGSTATGCSLPVGAVLRLEADDVARWARASGDDNRLHLVPGAARAAGLPVGEGLVVAHGLLVAALSFGAVPPRGRGVDLRFAAPVAVPDSGIACVTVDSRQGCAWVGSDPVLRRCDLL